MRVFMRFAKMYYDESMEDRERAGRAFEHKDYPQAVFYAQQSLEKGVKAMLEAKMRVVHNNGPELIGVFAEVFEGEWRQEFDQIIEGLEYLTE